MGTLVTREWLTQCGFTETVDGSVYEKTYTANVIPFDFGLRIFFANDEGFSVFLYEVGDVQVYLMSDPTKEDLQRLWKMLAGTYL